MQLKIISYNIWDLPLWFVKNRKKRVKDAVKYLASSGADIICIQESWHLGTRKEILYKLFSEAGYFYASGRDKPILYGNSGLVTLSKFPIRSKEFSKFPPVFPILGQFQELFTGRGVLETVIETPLGLLRVFNTHLHMPDYYKSRQIRLKQMQSASEFIALKNKDGMPSIFAGDFNEDKIWDAPDFMAYFKKLNFHYPFLEREDSYASTYRIENSFVDMWPNNYDMDHPKRFDYIFLNNIKKLGIEEVSYKPLYFNPTLSDHDPVEIILSDKK